MESRAIIGVEPVARVERQEMNHRAFWQLCRLVDHEPTIVNAGLQSHDYRIPCDPLPARRERPVRAVDGAQPTPIEGRDRSPQTLPPSSGSAGLRTAGELTLVCTFG